MGGSDLPRVTASRGPAEIHLGSPQLLHPLPPKKHRHMGWPSAVSGEVCELPWGALMMPIKGTSGMWFPLSTMTLITRVHMH